MMGTVDASAAISFENPTLRLKYFLLVANPVSEKQISLTLSFALDVLAISKVSFTNVFQKEYLKGYQKYCCQIIVLMKQ